MEAKCRHCQVISKFIEGDCHGQTVYVCTNCETSDSSVVFQYEAFEEGRTTNARPFMDQKLPRSVAYEVGNKINEGLSFGLSLIKILTDYLKVPKDVGSEAELEYHKVYHYKDEESNFKYRNVSNVRKRAMAAVCFYSIVRSRDYPCSIMSIISRTNCTKKQFHKELKSYRLMFNTAITPAATESLIPSFFTTTMMENKTVFIEKTEKLFQVFRKMWLIEGRCQRTYILISAYIAWQSLCPGLKQFKPTNPKRKLTNFKDFVETVLNNTSFQVCMQKSLSEAKTALLKLAKELPEKEMVNKNNLFSYIDRIIKFQSGLVRDVVTNHPPEGEEAPKDEDFDEAIVYKTFRNKRSRPADESETTTADMVVETSNEENWDEELDNYIRTPAEVEKLKKFPCAQKQWETK